MKIRLTLLALLVVLGIVLFCACAYNTEDIPTSDTESVTESSKLDETPDTSQNDKSQDSDNENSNNEQITITYLSKANNYYPKIQGAQYVSENILFPKTGGPYFQIISSNSQLQQFISNPYIDPTIFQDNYVMCITNSTSLGYYDLKYENGEYSISVDEYSQNHHIDYVNEESVILNRTIKVDFIVVPKDKVPYGNGIQSIKVNKNTIVNNELVFLENDKNIAFTKEKPTSWIISKDSELIGELGIARLTEKYYDKNNKTVVVYLPNKPTNDFLITEAKTEGGNLYLTVESYLHLTNYDLKQNDVSFYQLSGIDTSLLSENFRVFVTVNKVDITKVPTVPDLIEPNIVISEAIMIAQAHFFENFAEELTGGYYTAKNIVGENSDYWYIHIFDKGLDETYETILDNDFIYAIDKRTGEIVSITVKEDAPIVDEDEAISLVKDYYLNLNPEENETNVIFSIYYEWENIDSEEWLVVVKTTTEDILDFYSVNKTTGDIKRNYPNE